jgi:hypothetical protein
MLRRNKTSMLDEPIDKILEELRQHDPDDEEFEKSLSYLERLMILKGDTKERRISWDTIALGAFGLVQILAMMAYEQRHVMNQKVLGFVMKPKAQGR